MKHRTLIAGLIGCALFGAYGVALLHAEAPAMPGVLLEGNGARLLAKRPARLAINGKRAPALGGGAGLRVAVWEFPYLGRPASRIGHGFFERPRATWVQDALRLELRRSALDDGKAGGADLVEVLRPALRQALLRELAGLHWVERTLLKLLVGSLQRVDVAIRLEGGALRLHARATFVNAGQPLIVDARSRVTIGLQGHSPRLLATEVVTLVEAPESAAGKRYFGLGELRARAVRGLLARYAPPRVRSAVGSAVAELRSWLGKLAEMRTNLRLAEQALKARWRLSTLEVAGEGLRASFDVAIEGGAGDGPAVAWSALSRCAGEGAPLTVGISAGLVDALLDSLWQRGAFDRVVDGLQPSRLLTRQLASLLSFDIASVKLARAPRLIRSPEGWALGISPLRLRLRQVSPGDRRVPEALSLHGWARIQLPKPRAGRLRIALEPRELVPSCGSGRDGDPLRPCLEGLSGLARGWLLEQGAIDPGITLGAVWERELALGGELGLKMRAVARRVSLDGDVEGAVVCGGLRFSAP